MFRIARLTTLSALFVCSSLALAKAPATAPTGSTGMCKDGTYTSAASKSGACSGHDGVKKWYGVAAEVDTAASAAPSSEKGASTAKTKSRSKSEAAAPADAAASSSSDMSAASSKSKKKTDAAAPGPGSVAASTAADATGTCKDGTSTSAASKSGACSGHGGVKDWYAAAGMAPATGATMNKAAPAATSPPASPSAAATGSCKDGTSTSAASKSGACSGHGGVKDWYAAGATAPVAGAPMSNSTPPAAAPAVPGDTPARTNSYTPPATPAPGGGQGQVWVNKLSKVYHCPNDQWYGKTKEGAYMSEADAVAQGYRADHGRACQ